MMFPPGFEPKQPCLRLRLAERLILGPASMASRGPASMASPGLGLASARTSTLLAETPLKIMPPEPSHLPWCGLIAHSSTSGSDGAGSSWSISSSADGVCSSAGAAAAPASPPAGGCAAAVEGAGFMGDKCQAHRQPRRKAMPTFAKPTRTLLVAYLPRCAKAHDVQNAVALAGIGGCCFVNIMRDQVGESKCFGFAQFSTCDLAMAAMVACRDGKITLPDYMQKPWHVKADWAKADCRDSKQKRAWQAGS